jgi:hypothetical protein
MSKYKAGDKVTIVLDNCDAETFNEYEDEYTIIAHEAAPEPIVRILSLRENGYISGIGNDKYLAGYPLLGKIKVTVTGNDFTVEKVTL